MIELGIDESTALAACDRAGSPIGRPYNRSLVHAFSKYNIQRKYVSANRIEFEKQWFRISRDVSVPVTPLFILHEHGEFVPVFLCGGVNKSSI